MIWLILLLAAVVLGLLQSKWAQTALQRLKVDVELDQLLVQPGESVKLRTTVANYSKLPVLFVRLQVHLPLQAKIAAEPAWIREHCTETLQRRHVEERFSLFGLRSSTRTTDFAVSARGEYRIGSFRLSTGDLLGFRESSRDGTGQSLVVMPDRAADRQALSAVGGFLGDRSVRRFIMEDPVLTVGFRDYTGSEPMKAISWTRSAVAGKLQVKQFDHTAEQTVMVLLNVEGGRPEQLEGCFRLARMACEQLEKRKISYGLRTNGNLPGPVSKLFYLPEGLGESHLHSVLYSLGRADYACYYSLGYLLQQTLQHRRNNEAYILITPVLGPQEQAGVRRLASAAGNEICVLVGEQEVRSE